MVLFYDVADTDDKERYSMIRGHLQTRAVDVYKRQVLYRTEDDNVTVSALIKDETIWLTQKAMACLLYTSSLL